LAARLRCKRKIELSKLWRRHRPKIITPSGIKKTATADDIRKAFRKLARKHHPDVNPGDKKAEEKFKEISEANDVLSDEKKRKVYDALGYYSDQIDPAAAEAAARGGYGLFRRRSGGGARRGSQAAAVASHRLWRL
jgi:molecular chaperone DnaJ